MKTITYDQNSSICQSLIQKDPLLKDLFEEVKSVNVTLNDDYFKSLAFTILSQQLSSKVANVIINRFINLYQNNLIPEDILKTDDAILRGIGLSYQKISYVKSLSDAVLKKIVDFDHIELKSDQVIKDMLIKVKGIGPWSAEMFLMFSLGREDVFSSLDLGLRNACKALYQNDSLSTQEIEDISLKWKPYRSIVSHFFWHMHDRVLKK